MTQKTWELDKHHSFIQFSIKHLMIAKVRGSFCKFDAKIVGDPEDLTTASIDLTIDVDSIDTNSEDRDEDLLSSRFFDVEKYPTITFKSKSFSARHKGMYVVTGDLTIHGVTNEENFTVIYEGTGVDPDGIEKVIFDVEGLVDRTKYGLVWNKHLEKGGVLIGDIIRISFELQAIEKKQ